MIISNQESKMPKKKNEKRTVLRFRERKFGDIDFSKVKHPKPGKDYKATLPGPPGWQYKIDPGR